MSTVTIFCREGACNVEGHTIANCHNRHTAKVPNRISYEEWRATRLIHALRDKTGRSS